MDLSLVEALCLDVQSIWISEAQYAEAERRFHIAEQKQEPNQGSKLKKKSKRAKEKPAMDVATSKPKTTAMKPKTKSGTAEKQKIEGLTPYQGENRCFGKFKCKLCNRKWQSGCSWANMGQQCKKCLRMIFPHKQQKLGTGEPHFGDSKHDVEKCGKCQKFDDCRY